MKETKKKSTRTGIKYEEDEDGITTNGKGMRTLHECSFETEPKVARIPAHLVQNMHECRSEMCHRPPGLRN